MPVSPTNGGGSGGGGGGGGGGGLTQDETDARVRALVDDFAETGTQENVELEHDISRIPGLVEKTQDIAVDTTRAWVDTASDSTVKMAITQAEAPPTNVTGLTFVPQTITITAATQGDYWLVFEVPADKDPRDYRLKSVWPAVYNNYTDYSEVGGYFFEKQSGERYHATNYNFIDGLVLTLQVHEVSHVSHFRGEVDAVRVDADNTNFDEKLAGVTNAQAALEALDEYEVIDITDENIPTPAATEANKLFVDRIHKTVRFLTEERIAQTDASGNFDVYDSSDAATYLGAFATDHDAGQHVANDDADINKFYWNWSHHTFRYWKKTTILSGVFDYHWSDVITAGQFLAARESFDHTSDDISVYWVGYAESDAILRARIPEGITDGSRVYGVRLNSNGTGNGGSGSPNDGIIGVRKIDGSAYTEPTNAAIHYGYSVISVAGTAGATISNLDAAIDALRTEIIASAPSGLNTLNELAAAIDDDADYHTTVTNAINAKVTNTTLNVDSPTSESTTVAASRRQVATAISNIEVEESGDTLSGEQPPFDIEYESKSLGVSSAIARQVSTLVSLSEGIDEKATYFIMFGEDLTSRGACPTQTFLGELILNDTICPVTANQPSSTEDALALKPARTNQTTLSDFGHDTIYIWRRNTSATQIWMAYASANSPTSRAMKFYKIISKVSGSGYSRVKGADVVLGGNTAGQADGTLTNAVSTLLGYPTTITEVTVAHSTSTTLKVVLTSRAPADDRPTGINFLDEEWEVANALATVATTDGLSTITWTWDVPTALADSASDVEGLRGTATRVLTWLVSNTDSVRGQRLPADTSRTTNALAQFNATTDIWEMVDVTVSEDTSGEQHYIGTYTEESGAIATGGTVTTTATDSNRYDGTLGTVPSMSLFSITSILKTAIISVQIIMRVQNRFDIFLTVPRKVIETVGYTNAESWQTAWHASNNTIIPAVFVEWVHATGAENRGMPLARPSYFHVNAARLANVSSFLLFFSHHTTNDEDFRGIGIIASSNSSLVLTRADVLYNSAVVHTGS